MSDSLDCAPALIFIPDLNGFTSYISKTDIGISKKVIPALLETIIDANELDMSMAEIQGDAILFYRIGELPCPGELVAQSRRIFQAFKQKMHSLSQEFPEANFTAESLGIKIIVHYGEIALAKVRGLIKLIGPDVIVAHRLLKNSIKSNEYLLLTEQYISNYNKDELAKAFAFGELKKGEDAYSHIGPVHYRYISLKPLY